VFSNITKDETWGYVLIAVGIASLIWKPFDRLNGTLKGEPDRVLTLLLIGLAMIVAAIAFRGSPSLKALTVFWIVSP
jgi:hypothetical protein